MTYSDDQKRSKDNTVPYTTKETASKDQDVWSKIKIKKLKSKVKIRRTIDRQRKKKGQIAN